MMPHTLETNSRTVLEQWAMQHFKSGVYDTVLHNDPGTLPETVIETIENHVLADAKKLISGLNDNLLCDRRYMNCMISESISDVKDQLRKAATRQAWERQRRAGR